MRWCARASQGGRSSAGSTPRSVHHCRGWTDGTAVYKIELLAEAAGFHPLSQSVVSPALAVAERTGDPMPPPWRCPTAPSSQQNLGAAGLLLLPAPQRPEIPGGSPTRSSSSPSVIAPVQDLKVNVLGNKNPGCTSTSCWWLSICAVTDPNAKRAVQQLQKLRGARPHHRHPLQGDEDSFHRSGVRLTSEPKYQTSKLYHG